MSDGHRRARHDRDLRRHRGRAIAARARQAHAAGADRRQRRRRQREQDDSSEDVLTRVHESDATIYTVALVDPLDARRQQSETAAPPGARDRRRVLSSAARRRHCRRRFERIAKDIRNAYTLAYTPTKRCGDAARAGAGPFASTCGRRTAACCAVRTRDGYFEKTQRGAPVKASRLAAASRRIAAARLRRSAASAFMPTRRSRRGVSRPSKPPPSSAPRSAAAPARVRAGGLVGMLDVPRLQLSTPVIEGDDDRTLKRAVGHLPDTPLPWENGQQRASPATATACSVPSRM